MLFCLLSRETLAARKRVFPANHPLVYTSMNGLGLCLMGLGNPEAMDLISAAVQGRAATLGEEHPDTLCAKANLELCQKKLGM